MEQQQELDTFEDGPYTDGPTGEGETFEEGQEGQDTEEESVQADKSEEIDPDSQVNLLDEKEDVREEESKEEGEEKTAEGDEKSKEADENPEPDAVPKDDAGKDDGSPEDEVRTIKGFSHGKQYEVPEDLAIKTKVAGKWEKPTLAELKDNYSGVIAHDRRFTELAENEKTFEAKHQSMSDEVETIKGHFTEIRKLTESGMKGEGDPVASMNYLLDLMNINTVDYNKAMFENMVEEYDTYLDLTQSEREAHWTQKENAYLVKRQESLTTNQAARQSQADAIQRVNSLREAHSISEEDYVSAEQDLKANNIEGVNPEMVVKAAQLKPLLNQADDLIESYIDQMTDDEAYDLSVDIATTMLESPELSVDQVKKVLAERFEVETIVSSIEKKIGKEKQTKVSSRASSDELEFFDD